MIKAQLGKSPQVVLQFNPPSGGKVGKEGKSGEFVGHYVIQASMAGFGQLIEDGIKHRLPV